MTSLTSLPKILLIDDAAEIHRLVKFLLRDMSIELRHAYSGREGLEMADFETPDLILLDYQMPTMDGPEVLKQLKATSILSNVPVVFVTSSDDPTLIAEVFANGATDYIRKPLQASELQARVSSTLRTQSLIRELTYVACYDTLTELPNRWQIKQNIEQAIQRYQSSSHDVIALLHINFDRFRFVNDSLGHGVGDQLLKEAARRIQRVVSSLGHIKSKSRQLLVSRLGSDEFVVMIEGVVDASEVESVAEKLMESICDRYITGSHNLYLEASIGVVISKPSDTSPENLLRDADTALHEAKLAGYGRYRVFDAPMRQRVQGKLKLENDLRHAFERDEFHLLYQPLIDLNTGETVSVESLIRWNHGTRGLIGPDKFIPFAEETGLIVEIGSWCIQTACNQLAQWQRDCPRYSPPAVSINIARQQLVQPSFFDDLRKVVTETGVLASSIHLEITENEMMSDTLVAIEVMNDLRRFGFKIDLDDFGTGHSSLACLNEFPIDILKLDRGLISGISEKGFSAKLVEFVLRLARETSVSVVAEGIETQEQAKALLRWGCEFGQGYLFAKPMPAVQIPSFVRNFGRSEPRLGPRIKPRRTVTERTNGAGSMPFILPIDSGVMQFPTDPSNFTSI